MVSHLQPTGKLNKLVAVLVEALREALRRAAVRTSRVMSSVFRARLE